MKEKQIGNTRTFERFLGNWKIIDILKGRNIKADLMLNPATCPQCGCKFGDKRTYVFNYLEILKEGQRKLHLGVSDCNRYIILEDYLGAKEIKKMVE